LLNRYTALKPYRGFESLRLRHFSKSSDCLSDRPPTVRLVSIFKREGEPMIEPLTDIADPEWGPQPTVTIIDPSAPALAPDEIMMPDDLS
jgi:hypothetical protein